MSNTTITDRISNELLRADFDAETEIEEWRSSHRELELAANKLYSQLSIWANVANDVSGYANTKDLEALAEFELLRKP